MLFRFLYILYWDLIISISVRWLYFKLLHFLRLGMKGFFTLSFGFLEVLTSKFWVYVLRYMKLSWQISIAIVMHYSFEVIVFSLIFFLLCSHIFALPFELMWFNNYKLQLFFLKYFSYIWPFLHFYSIFYTLFYVAGSWILMNKLRLCVNLIYLFFKFCLSLAKNKSWNHKCIPSTS